MISSKILHAIYYHQKLQKKKLKKATDCKWFENLFVHSIAFECVCVNCKKILITLSHRRLTINNVGCWGHQRCEKLPIYFVNIIKLNTQQNFIWN